MEKSCFVICPIGDDGTQIRRRSNLTFDFIISPVVNELGYEAVRADKIKQTGMITSQIVEKIISADLVIADLSDNNPNVFYELAIRHAINKACIQLISPPNVPIPFDIRGMRTIFYDVDIEWGLKAKKELRDMIVEIETNGFKSTNPVSDSITRINLEEQIRQRKEASSLGTSSDKLLEAVYQLKLDMDDIRSELSYLSNNEVKRRKTPSAEDVHVICTLNDIMVERATIEEQLIQFMDYYQHASKEEKKELAGRKRELENKCNELRALEAQYGAEYNRYNAHINTMVRNSKKAIGQQNQK